MSATTGEIQPVVGGPWVVPEVHQKETPSITPVAKTGKSASGKVGQSKSEGSSIPNFPFPSQGFSIQDFEEIQEYLQENMGIQLRFIVDGSGKSVVELLDGNTGQVIRQIPPEQLAQLQAQPEQARGILFNGQA